MGWIEEQLKQRKELDNQMLSDSFFQMANAVTGKIKTTNYSLILQNELEQILRFYHCDPDIKIPDKLNSFEDKLDYICSKNGLSYREVNLSKGWYKDASGAYIGFKKESNEPVALLPCWRGYTFQDNDKNVYLNRRTQNLLENKGLCFYKSFPNKKLKLLDLIKFGFSCLSFKSYLVIVLMMLVTTLMGLLTPKITYFLYGSVVEFKNITLLVTTILLSICITVSSLLLNAYKSLYTSIVETKVSLAVEAATMKRIFSLKPNFFKKFTAGELSARGSYVNSLVKSAFSLIFNTALSSLFSLVYIGSILEFAPSLVIPSLVIIFVFVGYSVFSTLVSLKISRKRMEINAKESGISYSLVNGIQKIRLAGAEKRVFSKWANLYAESAKLNYCPPSYIKYNSTISLFITLVGTIAMYFFAIQSGVSVAEYGAFVTAFGMVYGAFYSLSSIALSIASLKPHYDLAKQLLDAKPEEYENKEIVTSLLGNIEISNISFRYEDSMPLILDNLSLKIKSGEYVAIVGKTGCGKSTLVKLLLGFEQAQKGTIYFDSKDISSLNLKTLRRKIGTVYQNGKLIQGSIFSNIAICSPTLTLDEAFEAADIAGIGDDIRAMPMGMNTIISEGGGGISGGQKQRILIARAIAGKPKILILDEATSALDNITQKHISDSLDSLNCTRIVIAHRLSTIKKCDRIIYIEDGKIAEEGTYDQLMKLNSKFAELVKHQLLVEKLK